METNVFPVATRLVTAPDTGITLRACPSVERNDEGASVRAIVGHDFAHIGHTIKSERITGTYPGHVGFEHTHSGIAHFLHNVALQQSFDALFGVQVALRPKSDFDAFRAGIVAKLFQVLNVSVEGFGLSVAGSVAVVGQEPSEGHIVLDVAVNGGTCRELVVVLFAVQAFLHAAVILLAFVVSFAIFVEHESVFGFGPVVTIVGIEVSLVKAEFRQ